MLGTNLTDGTFPSNQASTLGSFVKPKLEKKPYDLRIAISNQK